MLSDARYVSPELTKHTGLNPLRTTVQLLWLSRFTNLSGIWVSTANRFFFYCQILLVFLLCLTEQRHLLFSFIW